MTLGQETRWAYYTMFYQWTAIQSDRLGETLQSGRPDAYLENSTEVLRVCGDESADVDNQLLLEDSLDRIKRKTAVIQDPLYVVRWHRLINHFLVLAPHADCQLKNKHRHTTAVVTLDSDRMTADFISVIHCNSMTILHHFPYVLLHLWQAPLGVRSAKCRHQSPLRVDNSQPRQLIHSGRGY